MLIEQPSLSLRWLYPLAYWRMAHNDHAVYLTFDDGPIPEVTPWVLDVLDHYQVKATFFMVGDNVRKHPETFEQVKAAGHRLGNHTFNHIGGLRHSVHKYMLNVEKANAYIRTDLFRPPHGWMKWGQYIGVLQHHYVGLGHARLLHTPQRPRRLAQRPTLYAQREHHNLSRLTQESGQTPLCFAPLHRMVAAARLCL